ncbi:MAG: hypothetical protein QF473_14155 [Planctomycetota bacterium]|nr:hypothetical protein [Planctomycetota bacterium]MDP6504331.1 hypothetical protein [Planctomycetota bacterium]
MDEAARIVRGRLAENDADPEAEEPRWLLAPLTILLPPLNMTERYNF